MVHNFDLEIIFSWLTFSAFYTCITIYIIATDAFHVITTVSSRTCKIHIYFIKEPAMQFVFVLQRNEIQTFDMYKVHVYISNLFIIPTKSIIPSTHLYDFLLVCRIHMCNSYYFLLNK